MMDKLLKDVLLAKEKIAELRKRDTLVFPFFTDLHAANLRHVRAQKLITVLKLIAEEIDYDAVINMGDNVSMLGRDMNITNENLKIVMEELLSSVYDVIGGPLLLINGNHDAVGTDFFKPDFWNEIVKNKYGNSDAQYGFSGSYYYLDFEKAETRLICLSLPCESELQGEFPTPVWRFGEEQLRWLKDTALNTQKSIIIISHVPFFYFHDGDKNQLIETWDGERIRRSYVTDLCGRIEDCSEAVGILQEFHEKSRGKLVACLSGHTHKDSLWKPLEKRGKYVNPLPCPQVVLRGACIPENEHMEYGISLDIAVWTPSENKFQLVRIGDGEDRSF